MTREFDEIIRRVLQFRDERDWRQFHDPKNLAEAISIESGELLENFLWIKNTNKSYSLDSRKLKNVTEEAADIMIYLLYLCDALNIDLTQAVVDKIEINEKKYPVDKAKGNSKKYRDLT